MYGPRGSYTEKAPYKNGSLFPVSLVLVITIYVTITLYWGDFNRNIIVYMY